MDEAAIRRLVGGRQVMRAQLDRLREAAAWPNVTIQVIPLDAGSHHGMDGSFIVLEFPDPADQSIVYTRARRAGCSWRKTRTCAGISFSRASSCRCAAPG